MLLGSPLSVQVLLALSVLTLGSDSEPQNAPRVFLSFKGIAAPFVWPVVWRNRVNVLEYTFLTCYLLVFMTDFDELINVLGSVGNSQRRQILQFNHTPNECKPSVCS
ncbi:hypothetical protein DPX16_12392 [Anabarilius grahami]|uniref:Uncharacterized protein n=1 Tax=Anabarilius grahami TaxID=495550 RepID=A0A3N0XG02_ANAGA|nr:hypothetical protein DPX16_12392 [Anabarilius grahami]